MKILERFGPVAQDIIYSTLGVLFSAFALKSFLVPNNFLDGGVTGMSLLLHETYHINIALVLILANIPLLIMGGMQISWKFAIRSLLCVIGLAICLQVMSSFEVLDEHTHHLISSPFLVSTNPLIVSIFGGFFLGLGIGLGMRGGVAIDGIEILALYTLKRSSFTISEIILGLNVIIFLLAALGFGLEKALFAMLTYFVATRTIDYVIEGLEEFTGVTIISAHSEEIKRKLVLELGRGITIYKGERGFMKDSFEISQDTDIVFTVITRLEVRKLKNMVHGIDPKAFVFTNTIKEAAGGVLKRAVKH